MNASPHPIDDLPGMLHGELTLEQLRSVTTHLRSCEACRRELVELATGAAATARAARDGLVGGVPTPLPPLDLPTDDNGGGDSEADLPDVDAGSGRRTRWLALVAALVVALVVSVAVIQLRDPSSDGDTTRVALDAVRTVGDARARGTVSMRDEGAHQVMVISTNLPRAQRDHYYEVWLLDTSTNGMVAVGVLPNSGRGEFTLPKELVARYDAIDLSLQPDNGQTVHSSDSVLRARYA